jgi:hypothetical protein
VKNGLRKGLTTTRLIVKRGTIRTTRSAGFEIDACIDTFGSGLGNFLVVRDDD